MNAPQEVLTPGRAFGRYKILRRIGAGGMGAVYEALHIDLKKRVAIKALLPSMTENAETKARFLREGEASARIRHPHVVDVYDVGFLEGVAFLVMEYLDGEDLNAWLRREKHPSEAELADIMLPVCSAIEAAHEQGVVHRDMKPANIFLARTAHGIQPKVLDFGISKILADPLADAGTQGLTTTGAVLGTPYYMSPEQAHGGVPIDGRSDQYSIGVILYQCATGQRPFDAPSMYQVLHKIVQGTFDPPRTVRPDLSPEFEAVIMRAMAREPKERFASASQLGAMLLDFATPRGRVVWEPMFAQAKRSLPPPTREMRSSPLTDAPRTPSTTLAETGSTLVPAKSNTPLLVAAGVAMLLAAFAISALVFSPSDAELVTVSGPAARIAETYSVAIEALPSTALIELDGARAGVGRIQKELARDGSEHELVVSADGFEKQIVRFRDAPPPSRVELRASPPPPPPVEVEKPTLAPAPKKAVAPPKLKPKPSKRPAAGANEAPIIE
jgi:eukaryotic-like serine/threonine-protein kinase